MEFDFRNTTGDDLGKVAALYRGWVSEASIRGLVANAADDLRCRLGPHFILATHADDRIVGFSIAEVFSEYVCVSPCGVSYMSFPIVANRASALRLWQLFLIRQSPRHPPIYHILCKQVLATSYRVLSRTWF